MNNQNALDFLEKVVAKVTTSSNKLIFNKKYARHLYLIALYCRIIELTHSCTILMKEKIISGVPVILRTVLEAYADLKNLIADENYVNYMEASHLEEWRRIIKEAKNKENPYLCKIAELENLRKAYEDHTTTIEELKDNKYVALSHYDRFEKAGLVKEYRSIYNFLCSHSHNNIRCLHDRYTTITGNDFDVVCYKDPQPHDFLLYSTSLCDILVDASSTVHTFFETSASSEIESIHKEWEDLKIKYGEDC
jgi:hypothetical protein